MLSIFVSLVRAIITGGVFPSLLIALFFWFVTIVNVSQYVTHYLAYSAAKHNGPPAAISIREFNSNTHPTDLDEVTITAQIDSSVAFHYELATKYISTQKILIPLLDTAETNPRPYGFLVLNKSSKTQEKIGKFTVGAGSFGPIILVNGLAVSGGMYAGRINKFLMEEYSQAPKNLIYIEPFFGDRLVELAPEGFKINFVIGFAVIATAFSFLTALKFRKTRRRKPAQPKKKQGKKRDTVSAKPDATSSYDDSGPIKRSRR